MQNPARYFWVWAHAVARHWGYLVSGVIVTIGTYGWGQVRHWFQSEGPDIPFRVFYVVGVLLVFVACFLAWRDEHEAKIDVERRRAAEAAAFKAEIAALKSDPPVVLLEFSDAEMLHPS